MVILRDVTIIVWLLFNTIPQAQAWYLVQVDKHYELYAVEAGLWK